MMKNSQDEKLNLLALGKLNHIIKHFLNIVIDSAIIVLNKPPKLPVKLAHHLYKILKRLKSIVSIKARSPLRAEVWNLSAKAWNDALILANHSTIEPRQEALTEYRLISSNLFSIAMQPDVLRLIYFVVVPFFIKTTLSWLDFQVLILALGCYFRYTAITPNNSGFKRLERRKELVILVISISKSSWHSIFYSLYINLSNKSMILQMGSCIQHFKQLQKKCFTFGSSVTNNKNEEQGHNGNLSNLSEALKLMNEALEVCEKGLSVARTQDEKLELKGLRWKVLRFIAAIHLQKEEFESVIKCVKVLRDGGGGGGDSGGDGHPSLSVLAMKAWLGLGRHVEAEKELRGMVIDEGIPEGVWVSAVEAYFQAAGTAGAETAKGVFLGLLGRCHVSAGAAVRVAHRVVGSGGGSEGSRVRAKVVAELVSDERVVALFAGLGAAKDKVAMHAVLWNCGADNFQSKDYETSAELFEKSMLYIPNDTENRILRAKGFRVLCLCHLGLLQLDRAEEYINEAEKLEPNIVCAFLKVSSSLCVFWCFGVYVRQFKIYLQKNDLQGAIKQIEVMTTCLDFQPDFLSLSAHEAVACHALPVSVAALSSMLNFYTSGRSMPTAEVTVLRTLVTVLSQEPGNEQHIHKFLRHAYSRASDLGPDCFFGKEEVGRRERNWFAVTAWNCGTKTGQNKNYELSAEFLILASDFYALLEGSGHETNVMVCKSLVLAASSMIASELQTKTAMSEAEVKQAVQLLDRAGKMVKSISAGNFVNEDQTNTIESDLFFIYTFCAYDIQGRLNDIGSQLVSVKSFATSKACKPHHLLQLGLSASQGPRSNHEVATFSLNECLSSFLSSPNPDYENIALVIRKLIAIASIHKGDTDDDAVYGMYKQAYRIMIGLKENEYPIEEGKWLAMTAWNRASLPIRLGQIEVGKKWMSVGLDIAKHVPGMEAYKACMEDLVRSMEIKL
ncbi:unnamed protein product [Lupinus luteus]|uniref:Protein ZIP4 homolog n=1 Tax=Lupinus luteus TaxID=3873 RepID=A0AAV1W152_LUPLU